MCIVRIQTAYELDGLSMLCRRVQGRALPAIRMASAALRQQDLGVRPTSAPFRTSSCTQNRPRKASKTPKNTQKRPKTAISASKTPRNRWFSADLGSWAKLLCPAAALCRGVAPWRSSAFVSAPWLKSNEPKEPCLGRRRLLVTYTIIRCQRYAVHTYTIYCIYIYISIYTVYTVYMPIYIYACVLD